jgi:hypothetical protein
MASETLGALEQMTLRQLLDAYVHARLERRTEEMERLNREIDKRRARGEMPD